MVHGNRFNFIVDAIKLGLQVSVVSAGFYLLILFIITFIIYALPPFLSLGAVSLSVLFVLNRILLFLILNGIAAINVIFITKKYHQYGGETPMHHPVEDDRVDQSKASPKYALATLMIVTLLIQGFGAFKTSQSFSSPEFLEHKTYITSHRGNSLVTPENTIAAIKAAKK